MPDDVVITEKTSQAKDVRAAVGARFGPVLPAEGPLLALLEPEEVVPDWKRWAPVLLRPDGLYGTKPAAGGNKASKLKAIRDALKVAKRVWLATDCDREGQLIGQEILEHCRYRGEVRRVMFTAQDPRTIREAFAAAKSNREYASLYGAAVARQQADQIYNLSLTRTATVTLGRGGLGAVEPVGAQQHGCPAVCGVSTSGAARSSTPSMTVLPGRSRSTAKSSRGCAASIEICSAAASDSSGRKE